jgi:hypothetical protein
MDWGSREGHEHVPSRHLTDGTNILGMTRACSFALGCISRKEYNSSDSKYGVDGSVPSRILPKTLGFCE